MKRFWDKVDKSGDCWLWVGAKNSNGYGYFHFNGKQHRAHRFSWGLVYDKIPDNLLICHHCDNTACVRPSHLFLGTSKDNVSDMILKGRRHDSNGEGGNNKLENSDVIYIRATASSGVSQVDLAREFNVSESLIPRIIRRKRWTHI